MQLLLNACYCVMQPEDLHQFVVGVQCPNINKCSTNLLDLPTTHNGNLIDYRGYSVVMFLCIGRPTDNTGHNT